MCKKSLKDCTLLKDSNSHQTKCFTRISVLQTWIRLTHSFVRRGICQMFYVSKIPIILSSYSFTQADFVTLVTNFTSVFVNILILKHDVLQVFYIGFLCWFHSCFSQKDLLFWTCWSSWTVQVCNAVVVWCPLTTEDKSGHIWILIAFASLPFQNKGKTHMLYAYFARKSTKTPIKNTL